MDNKQLYLIVYQTKKSHFASQANYMTTTNRRDEVISYLSKKNNDSFIDEYDYIYVYTFPQMKEITKANVEFI